MEHGALPAPCLVSPRQTTLFSHLIPVFKAAQPVQLAHSLVHLTFSLVLWSEIQMKSETITAADVSQFLTQIWKTYWIKYSYPTLKMSCFSVR